ncbi:P1 family peptidase [Fuchsiella alkaliacetigena]|uniref:P1 family peptidase n=1 Tax=Fuchsiella alkaliacetigena TaxID=957042 RepID=UPI00200A3DC8|nr:P1 family peptidase [Fuchsiella alkaliacetigena]MCK8824923.1 P1 family peptidase [Fuchsiella alkaliacetigena]
MDTITEVQGIKLGHAQDREALTGCTVILAEAGAVAGVEVRGAAPGTREIELLAPLKSVAEVQAVLLTGGSAFGLGAAQGVMDYLEEQGIGYDVGVTSVPIVPAAVIFDLEIGDYRVRPQRKMGYQACENAKAENKLRGNVGVGMGATVAKLAGMESAIKSGLGMASQQVGELVVAALVVVNALGEVFDPQTDQIIAGVRGESEFCSSVELLKNKFLEGKAKENLQLSNTTLGVVTTNASLSKNQANKVAQMAQNGLAQRIRPVHSSLDGDTIFTLATGKIETEVDLIGTLAAEVVATAVLDALNSAQGAGELPAVGELNY